MAANTKEALTESALEEMISKAMPETKSPYQAVPDVLRILGQGATLGMADEIEAALTSAATGKPYTETRKDIIESIQSVRKKQPVGAFLTEIGGSIPLGRLGTGATPLRTMGRSGLMGGIYGGMSSEKESLGGQLLDTLSGTAISAPIAGLLHKFLPPTSPEAKLMIEKGVPLTVGQSAGAKSALGRIENTIMNTIPLAGELVGEARINSMKSFNRAAINDALSAIGEELPTNEVGEDAILWATTKYNKAWDDALEGLTLSDPQALNEVSEIIDSHLKSAKIMMTDKSLKELNSELTTLKEAINASHNNPQQLMEIYKTFRDKGFELSKGSYYEKEIGGYISKAADDVLDIILEYNPHKYAQYEAARNMSMAWIPVRNAATQKTALRQGYFNPRQLLDEVGKQDPTASKTRYFGGQMPQQQLARAAMETIGDVQEGSQTARRQQTAALLGMGGEAGGFLPVGSSFGTMLATAGLYANPVLTRKASEFAFPKIRATSVPLGGLLKERPQLAAEGYGLLDREQYPQAYLLTSRSDDIKRQR